MIKCPQHCRWMTVHQLSIDSDDEADVIQLWLMSFFLYLEPLVCFFPLSTMCTQIMRYKPNLHPHPLHTHTHTHTHTFSLFLSLRTPCQANMYVDVKLTLSLLLIFTSLSLSVKAVRYCWVDSFKICQTGCCTGSVTDSAPALCCGMCIIASHRGKAWLYNYSDPQGLL